MPHTHHPHRHCAHRRRLAMGLMAFTLVTLSVQRGHAQPRPAPPKGWTVDTSSGVPVAVRRGGALSSDARAELLGPVMRGGPALHDWIRTFARDNAATLGTVDLTAKDDIAVNTIAGAKVAMAAYTVRTAAGNRYLAYGVLQDTPAETPVLVVRSTFSDALTFVRVFRSSVEALLPYMQTPLATMRTVQPVAMAAAPVTSFRGLATATPAPADSTVVEAKPGTAASADTAVTHAVGAGIDDAVALLDGPAPSGRAAALAKVVFYQFGDLQFHPVALFADGTAFEIDEAPLEQLDAAASKRNKPAHWGRWRARGAMYYLSEARGPEREYTLDGGGFHSAFAAPPRTTLDGTYEAVSSSTAGETRAMLTTVLRFTPDGRFTGARDFGAIGDGSVSGVTMAAGASRTTRGRYRVSGHRLTLTYDSGAVKEYFFAFASGGEPAALDRDMIFIGATAYVR